MPPRSRGRLTADSGEHGSDAPPLAERVEEMARDAREASRRIAALPTRLKNEALLGVADALLTNQQAILAANARDVERAQEMGRSETMLDRLTLTSVRIHAIAEGVRQVAALSDPVGETIDGVKRPNGLVIQRMRVPLGVVGVIFDARPNVMVDAASLCLKSGNAVILRGDADGHESNVALETTLQRAIGKVGIPSAAVQLLPSEEWEAAVCLMRLKRYVDVIIPRGDAALIRAVSETATVPTIETGPGNCHTYVEASASLPMAADIAFNAKIQRPGVANSMETLLVDRQIAREFLPMIGPRMQALGVELRGCDETRRILRGVKPATEEDWATEYAGSILAIRIVSGPDAAIAHIIRYGSRMSEAIVTQDYLAAKRFCEAVDAAAVYVNASTRFTDGYEFGMGAEIGISIQKLHARGPIGLEALTTQKYVVLGEGQLRE
jgi:glutamate-5-semialdehyde dehydrogenase